MEKTLSELKKEMEEIQGQWNGDNPGRAEDRAHQAGDIIENINQIEKLLVELDDF